MNKKESRNYIWSETDVNYVRSKSGKDKINLIQSLCMCSTRVARELALEF